MFSWSFPKSSEAMFSRWAVKRIFKFLLKKKLGKFILGDIDLDQLDVQLGAGTIQLSDLSLNVDYINEKFGTTALLVKEGSIGSLTVTMPWKEGGCQVEIDELEVVLAPRRVKVNGDGFESCDHGKNGSNVLRKQDDEPSSSEAVNSSADVHEGVKTIANMVKWLLTSFHVKIKKLIVVFDPVLEEESRNVSEDRILVLRISEVECGTHISDDASSSSSNMAHNILGISRLTNFVKFQGAVLELLHMNGMDHQDPPDFPDGTSTGNWCSSGNMTTIVSGENGGFSGNLNCSLPWKNGTLDIRQVDADLHIEPLELRFQPSTVRSFISMWDLFNGDSEEREDTGHHKPSDNLSAPSSCLGPLDKGVFGNKEGFVTSSHLTEKEPVHSLLSESHLISDWISRSRKDRNEEEQDFGASVDQFFECFDGLRNSQSALGNSGMWNWTSSVFSAITAASSLASGSLQVTYGEPHVEINFSAAIEKVSLLLSLTDEDQKQSLKMMNEDNTDFNSHCLCMQFVDLFLTLQVRPLEMNFEVIVQHIQLVDHICPENNVADFNVHGCNGDSESALIRKMQDGVQGALRTFLDSDKDPGIDNQVNCSADISLSMNGTYRCCHMKNGKDICGKDASVTLLKTSDITRCHVRINMDSSSASLLGTTSISLRLPPFICWVNFEIITMMLEFLKEMATNCKETTLMGSVDVLESETKNHGFSHLSGKGKISISRPTKVATKKKLEVNIFLPNARILLCFPHKKSKDLNSNSSCNQFIAFDFISTTIGREDVRSPKPASVASSDRKHTVPTSCSLNFNFGDFYLFSISSALKDKIVGSETYNRQEPSFSVEKIISAVKRPGHMSLFSMLWQEGPATGPWIAKKAKLLASSENGRSEDNIVGKGYEYASVTTVKDSKNSETCTRQEILSSSAFFLHGQLPPVTISLDKSQFANICGLLNETFEHFSRTISKSVGYREEHSVSQTSVLVEFDSVTVSVAVEPVMVEHSIYSELPGSWSNLTLQVDKFELLSVSNIGGIRGANFLWVSHGQGTLWGSITKCLHQEFVLVSCNDSTMGRGDGEGSNILSSSYSGSDIINFWDPESNHIFTSVTVRGATIVAIGGRMDWFNTILSFFSLPSSEFEEVDDLNKTCGSSLILNLVDIGLSYDPHLKKLSATQDTDLESSYLDVDESEKELYVACVLAASSLRLSNTTFVDRIEGEYKVIMQDLGLLICMVSEPEVFGSAYGVDYLRRIGCVKVAQEAHIEALFRKNCENGLTWELECEESHVMLNACHDTTLGLLRLADQLQKLFAPDMQDYVVHLENRWNITQQVREIHGEMTGGGDFSPSLSHPETPNLDKKYTVGNLMDEISEDAFQVDKNTDGHTNFSESHPYTMASGRPLVASGDSSLEENGFIEEYFLSDLLPLSGLALKKQSSDILCCKSGAAGGPRIGNGGWYSDTSLRIIEDHTSKVEQINVHKAVDFEASSCNSDHVDVEKAKGRIILKNMNVVWRMYGGSDWSNCKGTSHTSKVTCSRDTAVCLELALSGVGFDYDVYPDGEISASRLSLTIQDFCLSDRSDDAPWKLVLGYHQSKKHPRNFSSKAVKIVLEAVRPDPLIYIEENRLRITLLPMRLHLHQSQLDFLINFFGGKNLSADSSPSNPLGSSKSGEPFQRSDNLHGLCINKEAFLTYFQKFDICPMLIRVDYSPCRVDLTALRGGNYVELVNLVPWKGVELQLKHVQGVGLYGWASVCETILGEWLEDISQNQIHKLFKGLPPIKSLVAVGSGARKLVSLPMKNYKKDHRLLKGMQRGTFAFLKSISIEAIGLGVHLAAGAHNILLQAEYILASIPPSVPWPEESRVSTNVQSNQPDGAKQGIQQAYESISDGLGKSASALVQSPLKKYQRGGSMGSALATAVQSAPAAVIAPASGAARAVHCALLGFRNSLDPERKRESLEKYLGRTPQRDSMQ